MKTRRFVTIILSVVFLSMSFTSPALASTWQFADGRSGTGEWRDGLYFNSSRMQNELCILRNGEKWFFKKFNI